MFHGDILFQVILYEFGYSIKRVRLVKPRIPVTIPRKLSLVRSTSRFILPYLFDRISVNKSKTAESTTSNRVVFSQIS